MIKIISRQFTYLLNTEKGDQNQNARKIFSKDRFILMTKTILNLSHIEFLFVKFMIRLKN